MEYRKITPELVKELNEAVQNNSGEAFFETLGFDVHDMNDTRWELSDVHTKGGVEMIITIDKDDWISSFEEYYDNFDIDYEIEIHREDPNGPYCQAFTCRESVEDFEDWDNYIKELVTIAKSEGKYKYKKHLSHDSATSVLIFPKIARFDLYKLDKLDDTELMDLYYGYSSEVLNLTLDDFEHYFNRNSEIVIGNNIKFIE